MSFTQKKRQNLNRTHAFVSPGTYCDGCDKRCVLGHQYVVCDGYYIYPTINNEFISWYIDENNKVQFTSVLVKSLDHVPQLEISTKAWARVIAELCDHYKTR